MKHNFLKGKGMKVSLKLKIYSIVILLIFMALIMGIYSFVAMNVAELMDEYNTAVNTYIQTAVEQLTMRVDNAPKEEFIKLIDNFIKQANYFRVIERNLINNAETLAQAIVFFRNYERVSNVSIDMANLKDSFSNAVTLSCNTEMKKVDGYIKDIARNITNIRDNLNNRNLLNTVNDMLNTVIRMANNYNVLAHVYEKMQNIATTRATHLQTMEKMINEVTVQVNNIVSTSSTKSIAQVNRASIAVLILIILMVVTALFSLATLQNTVIAPIIAFVNTAKNLTSGDKDLTIRLQAPTKDEIAELAKYFNTFIGSVQEIVREVKEAAGEVLQVV